MENGYLHLAIQASLMLLPFVTTLNVLILHPYGTGSHVKTLRHVSVELLAKGHRVTTVMMEDENVFGLLGRNHTQFVLPFNNIDGQIPYLTEGDKAHFVNPLSSLTYECNLRRVPYNNTNVETWFTFNLQVHHS
jgi:hypothetical protein